MWICASVLFVYPINNGHVIFDVRRERDFEGTSSSHLCQVKCDGTDYNNVTLFVTVMVMVMASDGILVVDGAGDSDGDGDGDGYAHGNTDQVMMVLVLQL